MENYIEITRQITTRTPLKRKPSKEELEMFAADSFFDVPDDLVDWKKEETKEEDYSFAKVLVVCDGKVKLQKQGKY